MNAHGTAHELPAGRLASFEDDDTDFASILGSRPRAAAAPAPTPVTPTTPPPAAAKPVQAKKTPAQKARPSSTQAPTPPATPKHSERANVIKSSSVHIPLPLHAQTLTYRDEHGMSNGQVVIAAIEYANPQLKDLIHPGATGGGLFAQRATKGTRLNEGPLTPLNVRLYEADYEVIDGLVKDTGAFSRGHLITVSLRYFFDNQ